MVNIIHKHIHEYDFPYDDLISYYKKDIINIYKLEQRENPNITDVQVSPFHPLVNKLTSKLNKLVKDNYWVGKPQIDTGLRVYIQDNIKYHSFYHNHDTLSSISGVFYTDIPQEGGELRFLINPYPDGEPNVQETITIKPKKNKVYLFPYWLYHCPLPQKDETPRICFNWLYGSPIRPIHKITAIPW